MSHCVALGVAAAQLRGGGVVAHATEAVFGLACDPWNRDAVERLLALKGRRVGKGLILVAAEPEQFADVLDPLPPGVRRSIAESWPGPVTWVVPHRSRYPRWITGDRSGVAVRVTAHPQFRALLQRFGGPVVSTSANPSGGAPARSAFEVRRLFGAALDLVLPGSTSGAAAPSEIRDALSGEVLRG